MTKPRWGEKRRCPRCGAGFYDLGKNPAVCPKCGTLQDRNAPPKARRGKKPALAAPEAKPRKPVKKIEGVDVAAFEDIEPASGAESEMEEIEEIDDIENLEELEDLEDSEEQMDDDVALEDEDVAGAVLVDNVSDTAAEAEDEEEEDAKKTKPRPKAKQKKNKG